MSKEEKKTEGMETESDDNPHKRQKTGLKEDVKQAETKKQFKRYVDAAGYKHIALKFKPDIPMRLVYIGSGDRVAYSRAEIQAALDLSLNEIMQRQMQLADRSAVEFKNASIEVLDFADILGDFIRDSQDAPWGNRKVGENFARNAVLEKPGTATANKQLLWLMRKFDQEYIKARPPKVHGFIMPGHLSTPGVYPHEFAVKVLDEVSLTAADFFRFVYPLSLNEDIKRMWQAFRNNPELKVLVTSSMNEGITRPIRLYMMQKGGQMDQKEREKLCDANLQFLETFQETAESLSIDSKYAKDDLVERFGRCFPYAPMLDTLSRCLGRKPAQVDDMSMLRDRTELGRSSYLDNTLPYAFAWMVQRVPYWDARSWLYTEAHESVWHLGLFDKDYTSNNPMLGFHGMQWSEEAIWSLLDRHPAVRAYRFQQTGFDDQGMQPVRNRLVNPGSEAALDDTVIRRLQEAKNEKREFHYRDMDERRNETVSLPRNVSSVVFSFLARYGDNPMMVQFACRYSE